MTKRYAIVVEKAASNYAAYVPDLPGCIATGATVEETERRLRQAGEIRRIARKARKDRERDGHLRHGGLPRDDDAQAVGERFLDARRELERPLGADPWTILRTGDGGKQRERGDRGCAVHCAPPAGRRSIDVRFAGTRYFFAACCTSAAVTFSSSARIVLMRFGLSS